MMEAFVKTDFEDLGEGEGGISAETDPLKHREVAKKMAPAFSMRNFKAKESTLQKYVDLFVDRMKELGSSKRGIEMRRWADWLSMYAHQVLPSPFQNNLSWRRDFCTHICYLDRINSAKRS